MLFHRQGPSCLCRFFQYQEEAEQVPTRTVNSQAPSSVRCIPLLPGRLVPGWRCSYVPTSLPSLFACPWGSVFASFFLTYLLISSYTEAGFLPACAEQACLPRRADAALRNSLGGWQHIWTCPAHGAASRSGMQRGRLPPAPRRLLPLSAPRWSGEGGWGRREPQRELAHHGGCTAGELQPFPSQSWCGKPSWGER